MLNYIHYNLVYAALIHLELRFIRNGNQENILIFLPEMNTICGSQCGATVLVALPVSGVA